MKTRNLFRALRSMIRSISVSEEAESANRRVGEPATSPAPCSLIDSPVCHSGGFAFIVAAAGSATCVAVRSSSRVGRLFFRTHHPLPETHPWRDSHDESRTPREPAFQRLQFQRR